MSHCAECVTLFLREMHIPSILATWCVEMHDSVSEEVMHVTSCVASYCVKTHSSLAGCMDILLHDTALE